jgi:hypothetical protein
VSSEEIEQLRAENAELRRRIELTKGELEQLRQESLARRAEVRDLVADLPTVVSRRTVLKEMLNEGVHHPDKVGVVRRAVKKLGRAPRKALRIATRSD